MRFTPAAPMSSAALRRPRAFLRFAMFVCVLALLPRDVAAVEGLTDPGGYWATTTPPFGADHAAVVLPARDLAVVIVADELVGSRVWALPLSHGDAWIQLDAAGPRFGPGLVAACDAALDRILVHGGRGADGSTWELRLDPVVTWTELIPAGEGPGARWNHVAIFDPARDRMIIHGGESAAGILADTWELRLQGANPRWRVLHGTGPSSPAMAAHAGVLDAARSRMLILGSASGGSFAVHELALRGRPGWRALPLAGGPGPLSEHSAVLDAAHDRILVHGGTDGTTRRDTWALDLAGAGAWTLLAPAGPFVPARSAHVAALDARRGRMLAVGGAPAGSARETWALATEADPRWNRLAPAFESPPSNYGAITSLSTVFDTNRQKLVALVGRPATETWTLSFAPDPHWARSVDAPRQDLDALYDAARDRVVAFGGWSQTGVVNDTWELRLGSPAPQWTVVPFGPAAPPSRRHDHVVAYDAARGRMLVFGGAAQLGPCSIVVDTYALTFGTPTSTWASIPAIPFPEGGWFPVGVVDAARDRFIVHGGLFACRYPGGHPSGSVADGTWALDLAQPTGWTRLTTPQASPGQLIDAAYDPVDRCMVGLRFGIGVAVLPLDPGQETWQLVAPRGLSSPAVAPDAFEYDSGRDRFVVLRASGEVSFYLPTRGPGAAMPVAEAGYDVPGAPEVEPASAPRASAPLESQAVSGAAPAVLALAARSPARGAITLAVAVPAGAGARVELHDVRGRLIASRELAAGTNAEVTFEARSLRAGIYFVRLRQEREVRVEKVVVASSSGVRPRPAPVRS